MPCEKCGGSHKGDSGTKGRQTAKPTPATPAAMPWSAIDLVAQQELAPEIAERARRLTLPGQTPDMTSLSDQVLLPAPRPMIPEMPAPMPLIEMELGESIPPGEILPSMPQAGHFFLADILIPGLGSLGDRRLCVVSYLRDAKCGFKVVTTIKTTPRGGQTKTDGPTVTKITDRDTLEVRKAKSTVTFEESPKGTFYHYLSQTTEDGTVTTEKKITCLKENCKKDCNFSFEWIKEKKTVENKEVEVVVGATLKCECPE